MPCRDSGPYIDTHGTEVANLKAEINSLENQLCELRDLLIKLNIQSQDPAVTLQLDIQKKLHLAHRKEDQEFALNKLKFKLIELDSLIESQTNLVTGAKTQRETVLQEINRISNMSDDEILDKKNF